jgi:hypothetical protein
MESETKEYTAGRMAPTPSPIITLWVGWMGYSWHGQSHAMSTFATLILVAAW